MPRISTFRVASEAGESYVQTTVGVLHVPDAIERYPHAGLDVYNRVSSPGQAGKAKLEEKTDEAVLEVFKLAPGKLRYVTRGVEEGKVSEPRRKLVEAARKAVQGGLILVASDLSRFIRSESYHRVRNPEAWPTPEEFAEFHRRTFGVICATLAHPLLTEAERHALTMERAKRAGKCGRPSEVDARLAMQILEELGLRHRDGKWENSIASAARRLRIKPGKIQRLLDSPVPEQCLPDEQKGRGLRWKDYRDPAQKYRDVWEQLGRPSHVRFRSEPRQGGGEEQQSLFD